MNLRVLKKGKYGECIESNVDGAQIWSNSSIRSYVGGGFHHWKIKSFWKWYGIQFMKIDSREKD